MVSRVIHTSILVRLRNGISVSTRQNHSKIKSSIMELLEDGVTEKTRIYKKLQSEYGLSQSEARIACKQVKIDLMLKLKTLQSGMLEF